MSSTILAWRSMARSCCRARSFASCSMILVKASSSSSSGLFCSSMMTCSIHFARWRTLSAAGLYLRPALSPTDPNEGIFHGPTLELL